MQDRPTRGLVDAPALHAHKPVLHHIDPPHPVLPSQLVQRLHHPQRGQLLAVHGHAVAFFELQHDVLRPVRRVFRGDRKGKHLFVGWGKGIEPRILQHTGLVGDMQKVPIHRIRFFRTGLNGNPLLVTVSDHLHPSRKLLPEPLIPPGCDHLHVGLQSRRGQLKPDLIITFPRGAVGQGLCSLLPGDFHHPLGDQRPCNRGPQEILPLINRPRPHHRINEVPGKLLLQVVDVNLARPRPPGLRV